MSNNIKMIDVSHHQGKINWSIVKEQGVTHVLIRGGYGRLSTQIDDNFIYNFNECVKYGFNIGVYWYSYTHSVIDTNLECVAFDKVLSQIDISKINLGLWYDLEYEPQILALTISERLACLDEFINYFSKYDLFTGVYCSTDFLINRLSILNNNSDAFKNCKVWVADYRTLSARESDFLKIQQYLVINYHQYTSTYIMLGITDNTVDCNYILNDLINETISPPIDENTALLAEICNKLDMIIKLLAT